MTKTIIPLFCAGMIATGAILSSCSKKAEFIGSWTATNPTDITSKVPSAATASSLVSINFMDNAGNTGGSVTLSSIIDVTQPVSGDAVMMDDSYEVSVAATANVGGTWIYKGDDRDELLLSFDMSTLNVNVDKNGVSFTQNVLTGAQQPQLDSLTETTATRWKQELTRALRAELSRYTQLDDVEVSNKGQVLSFEIHSPESKMHFRRVE
ncbi:MAG: hypothetical protein NC127_09825 [Muribaculum sp.]|nr:hypothetical protein [Muribaculum sp.]